MLTADVMAEVASQLEAREPEPALVSVPAVVALGLGTSVMAAVMVSLASGCHRAYRRPTESGEANFLLNQGNQAERHLWGNPGPDSRNTTISPSSFANTSSPLTYGPPEPRASVDPNPR